MLGRISVLVPTYCLPYHTDVNAIVAVQVVFQDLRSDVCCSLAMRDKAGWLSLTACLGDRLQQTSIIESAIDPSRVFRWLE